MTQIYKHSPHLLRINGLDNVFWLQILIIRIIFSTLSVFRFFIELLGFDLDLTADPTTFFFRARFASLLLSRDFL